MTEGVDIAANLHEIGRQIIAATAAAGRPAGSARLLAVSKFQPGAAIAVALAAGHRLFGENRVQEAQRKWPELRACFPNVALHAIGPLQTNKARPAVELFDCLETVDRPQLAAALAGAMAQTGRRPRCLVQVNTGAEPQKAGVALTEADAFIEACREQYGLAIDGLMCIPPLDAEPRRHFDLLRELAERHGLRELSMGMSADWPAAIAAGATIVRLGTAIFGPRPSGAETAVGTIDHGSG